MAKAAIGSTSKVKSVIARIRLNSLKLRCFFMPSHSVEQSHKTDARPGGFRMGVPNCHIQKVGGV
jgi:hypothetical protein